MMMAHPLALQLRNLQSLVELGVDKNTTVVFPAPLMSTIGELGFFLARENAAAVPAVSGPASQPVPTASVAETTSTGASADRRTPAARGRHERRLRTAYGQAMMSRRLRSLRTGAVPSVTASV